MFKSQQELNIHVNLHLNEKPFKCEPCDKAYPSSSSLNNHKLTHNGPYFKCEICDKMFTSKYNLVSHTKIMHAKTKECHKCEIC